MKKDKKTDRVMTDKEFIDHVFEKQKEMKPGKETELRFKEVFEEIKSQAFNALNDLYKQTAILKAIKPTFDELMGLRAGNLWTYYDACIKVGFSPEQAMALTISFDKKL